MKKILIALDYDLSAKKIAEIGFLLAKSMNAEVKLLHVILDLVDYSSSYISMDPLQLNSLAELQNSSQEFLNKIKYYLDDDSIQTLVKEGGFAEMILETATEWDADVIVIGSHSKKWLEKITMGSTCEKVFKRTTIPLLIVPTKKEE
ncbi:MAG: universal stress protein [Bacteroidota bacterium]